MRSKSPAAAYPQTFCNEFTFRLDASESTESGQGPRELPLWCASPRDWFAAGRRSSRQLRSVFGAWPLLARLAFRRSLRAGRSSSSLRRLCPRRVLQAVGRETLGSLRDLLIGQDERIADRERQIILLRDRLEFDGQPHRLVQAGPERNHTVIGEEAALAP